MWPMPLFLLFNTQTMHIESRIHYSIEMFSLKTLYLGGIRTRVFWGGCVVHCSTPPGAWSGVHIWQSSGLNRENPVFANLSIKLLNWQKQTLHSQTLLLNKTYIFFEWQFDIQKKNIKTFQLLPFYTNDTSELNIKMYRWPHRANFRLSIDRWF
jgi:hypothetical protein